MKSDREKFSIKFSDSFKCMGQFPIEKFIKIGPYDLRLAFCNKEIADTLIRPFQHLLTDAGEKTDFTIYAADGKSTIQNPPFGMIIKNDIDEDSNQNLYFNEGRFHFLHNTMSTITSLVDTKSCEAFYYIDSTNALPDYEKAAPFRMIFHWFAVKYNMSLIHGAVLAGGKFGKLIAGRGGVGKSTLSLLSFMNGTPFLGDDYVLIENKSRPVAYSLYNSIKVNPDIIGKYPFIDHYLANRTETDYEKGYLFANEIPEIKMSLSTKLNGILLITGERSKNPHFYDLPGIKSLSVIGSSTVFQMPGINRDFMDGIRKLVDSLDNHGFILGESINDNIAALSDFLDEQPLISVVMPVFNGSKHIKRAIDSVLAQSYENLEFVIVNDGSDDDTADIIKAYSDHRIKYIYQDNNGPGAARNNGIEHSIGKYIAFLDHDDEWYIDKLQKQLDFMRADAQNEVVYCRHNLIFRGSADDYPWIQKINGEIRYANEIPSSMFIKRQVFDRIGLFNPVYKTAEDSDLHLRIKDAGIRIEVMEDILFDKHIHGGNISQDIASNRFFLTKILAASIKRKHSYKNLKISVIIPAYNPDRHLISCIESVLSQSHPPYEIVITDDGSKNDVSALLSGFDDPRIKIYRQENKGISAARNFAVANSTGNILAFIDSDDLWTENKLELQAIRLISDPTVRAVFGCIRQFYSPEVNQEYRNKYYFEDRVTKGIIPGTLMIRKDDYYKVGVFNEALRLGELFEWIHRFKKQGFNYVVLPEVLMYRRLHYNNNGILNKKDRVDFAKAFVQIIKDKKNERK